MNKDNKYIIKDFRNMMNINYRDLNGNKEGAIAVVFVSLCGLAGYAIKAIVSILEQV